MPLLTGFKARYRCLDDIAMDFCDDDGAPGQFVALVGQNGAGKTTILDAIAQTVYRLFVDNLEFLPGVKDWFIRLEVGPGVVLATHLYCGFDGVPDLKLPEFRKTLYIHSGYLPTMPFSTPLHMGPKTGLSIELALMSRGPQSRVDAVHQWWLHQHWEYPKTTTLDRLWGALKPFLGDLAYDGVNPQDHLPQFDARGTKVSFNQLSSGERRLIVLFMEVAMHCGEDGLVLFDEPEAHFHPRWQQMLPAAFHELLPRGQVIVATHSPYIVEGMPAHQLFILGDMPW